MLIIMHRLNKHQLVTKIPTLSEVKFFIGKISPNDAKDVSTQTDLQWQILKVRFLLWKCNELLAAPMPGNPSNIYIIVSQSDAETGTVLGITKEHKFALTGPFNLTSTIYQLCITYSFSFRFSPIWNKISDKWIYSPDFVISPNPLHSIIWEPLVSDGELRSSVQAMRTQISFLNLDDYEVDFQRLQTKGIEYLQGFAIVLPALKECSLVSVSTNIPQSCPFPSYSLLRKHWKNMYGVRLPHDETGMLYIQVRFRGNQEEYTYPIICVRTQMLQLPTRLEEETISTFIKHMKERCQTVCGMPIAVSLESKPGPVLQNLREPLKEAPLIRISSTILSQPIAMTNTKKVEFKATGIVENTPKATSPLPKQIRETVIIEEGPEQKKKKFIPIFKPRGPLNSSGEPVAGVKTVTQPPAKFVPTFTVKSVCKNMEQSECTQKVMKLNKMSDINNQLKATSAFNVSSLCNLIDQPTNKANNIQDVKIQQSSENSVLKATDQPPQPMTNKLLNNSGETYSDMATSGQSKDVKTVKPKKTTLPPEQMESLVFSKMLHKANIPSLREFCKIRKIQGVSKANKEILLQKIYANFGINMVSSPSVPISESTQQPVDV